MTANTFFFGGMTTEAERKEAMTSPMWPIVVAAMNVCDGELRVGFIKNMHGSFDIELVNPSGFMVARVNATNGLYYMHTYNEGISVSSGLQRIKSKRPKYIAQQLRKPKNGDEGSELYGELLESLKNARFTPNKIIHEFLSDTVRSVYNGYSVPTASMSEDMVTMLLRVYMKEMHPSEVSAYDQTRLDNAYKKYCEKRNKLEESFSVARDLFSKDKWVLVYDYYKKSVILGAVSHHPAQAAIDAYIKDGSFKSSHVFSYAQMVHPFEWYPSFEAIPDNIRKELEVQLMMYKVNKNSQHLLPPSERGLALWAEGGIATYYGWGEAPVVIMDKQS